MRISLASDCPIDGICIARTDATRCQADVWCALHDCIRRRPLRAHASRVFAARAESRPSGSAASISASARGGSRADLHPVHGHARAARPPLRGARRGARRSRAALTHSRRSPQRGSEAAGVANRGTPGGPRRSATACSRSRSRCSSRHHGARVRVRRPVARRSLHQWPSYLAYVTSFLTIGGIWLAHHGIFRRLRPRTGASCASTCCC